MTKIIECRCPVCNTKHFEATEDLNVLAVNSAQNHVIEIKCRRCRQVVKYQVNTPSENSKKNM